jgi:hypothetical protein
MVSDYGNTIGIASAIFAGAVAIIWILFGLKHVFTYPLHDSRMDIRFLGVAIQRVPLSNIDNIEIIPFAGLLPFSRSFRPDLFFSQKWCGYNKQVVAIKKHKGLIKRIIISPSDPLAFVTSLKGKQTDSAYRERNQGSRPQHETR